MTMSENCNHDCGSCGERCSEDTTRQSLLEKPNELSNIKHVLSPTTRFVFYEDNIALLGA